MKLTVVLAVLIGTMVVACSSVTPVPVEPTPNIDATVEAKLVQEKAVDATVEVRLKEERASQPTIEPQPTDIPILIAVPITYTYKSLNDIGFRTISQTTGEDMGGFQEGKADTVSEIKQSLSVEDYDAVWSGEVIFKKDGQGRSEPLWVIFSDDPIGLEREQRIKNNVQFLGNSYEKTLSNIILICTREAACDYIIETLSDPAEEARVKQLLAITPTPYPTPSPKTPTPTPRPTAAPTPATSYFPIPDAASGFNNFGLMLNVKKNPFKDSRVRKAIQLAIDYQELNDLVFNGVSGIGCPLAGLAHLPSECETWPGLRPKNSAGGKLDIEKAKQLMAEAGYPDGFISTYDVRQGGTLPDTCAVIKQQLRRTLGIEGEIVVHESTAGYAVFGTSRKETYSGDWEIACQDDGQGNLDVDGIINRFYQKGAARNYTDWQSEKVDAWFKLQAAEQDPEKRIEINKELETFLFSQEDNHWITLGWGVTLLAVQWPNPPTGKAELILSSTKGPVGEKVTASGRGFTSTGYVVIWIDGDDDGQIDEWEYVLATDIKATEREFSHIFIVDSNFQGTSHINAMGGDGNAVNPARNPTFTVPGTYATPVPTPTPVPVPGNITIESSRKVVGNNVYLLTRFKNDSSDLLNMSATLDAYDSSGAMLIGNDIYVSTLIPAKSTLFVEGSRYIYDQANLNAVAHHASKYDLTTLTYSSPDWVSYSEVNESNNPYFKISSEWITNNTDQEIVVKALKRNWVEFVYPELPEGPYHEWPGTTGATYWTVQTMRLPGDSKMLIPFDTYGVAEWRVDSSP